MAFALPLPSVARVALAAALLAGSVPLALGQGRLSTMPRYDRYTRLRTEIQRSVQRGEITARWSEDGKRFQYSFGGKDYVFDIAKKAATEGTLPSGSGAPRTTNRRAPERGRQFDTATSPDGKQKAFHRDRNLYLSDANGANEIPITTAGDAAKRTKFGIASWVYGEELGVREAIWWAPDGKTIAYYGFDESPVRDYYLGFDQTKFYNTLDVEAYPKAGTDNPIVSLWLYDVEKKTSQAVELKFGDPGLSEYIYSIRWSPDGKELLFNRTNRMQNVMELCAVDPATLRTRVIVRESHPQSWADNSPSIRFLEDGKRFLWLSERSGFQNLYLGNLDGSPLKPITNHRFEVDRIAAVDEKRGEVYYVARSGETPYLAQLHRVKLNGTGDTRLTDPALSHRVDIAPDFETFLDISERTAIPPTTTLRNRSGRPIKEIATSDLAGFEKLGLKKVENFTFTAADGVTECYGRLHFPSDFDPSKKYPLVVSVYAGPESGGGHERFQTPDPLTEFGFLIASFDGRGTNGRGKAFKDAVYKKLGVVEIDDQAAGAKELAKRPYVNGKRVGIHGTSYGGYAAIMGLLRHPDVFHVGVASSSVTDWRHYDTIYTERYMGLPTEADNLKGYEEGSAMPIVRNLKGKLLIFFGTMDNNVHPSNSLQLIQALEAAGKSFDQAVGPDRGHVQVDFRRLWEYMIDHLILAPDPHPLASAWKSRATTRKTSR